MLGLIKTKMPVLALILVAFSLPTFFTATGNTFFIMVGCLVFLYVIAVSGLDIVFGYSGQISIGHAAFFAIGAYMSGILNNELNIPVIFTMFIASVIAAVIGALLAYPASKLVFHFLSLATIAFGEIVYQIIVNSPGGITGNFRGMFASPVSLFGFPFNSNVRFYYFGLICCILFLLVKHLIVRSKVGRAFIAIRENSRAADGMGIDVRKYKVMAFSISAFYTAFAGAMFTHFVRYISPETFTIQQSIMFIIMLLFGGTASLLGPVVGVVTVLTLTEVLRPLQEFQMLIFGVMMLLVIVVIPGGIWGTMVSAFKKLTGGLQKKGGASDA
ncbi:MAG: branched-chain amino acid ABC transporter permease [Oscillospiraceae bacterium]|nr:branched-chain amino acid ABC transporter permease [Oscillospiraceae bacterium]